MNTIIIVSIGTGLLGLITGFILGGIMSMAKDYSYPHPEEWEQYKKHRKYDT